MDRLRSIECFVCICERGSFRAAAKHLGISQSAVSRHIAHLEGDLNAALFVRSSAAPTLTREGRTFLERARRMLEELAHARDELHEKRASLRGELRVTAPSVLGERFVVPVVTRFALAHPGVAIELLLRDHNVDLERERIDVAVRVGVPDDSQLRGRRIAESVLVAVAAPGYVAAHGPFDSLDDVARADPVLVRIGDQLRRGVRGPGGLTARRAPRFVADDLRAAHYATRAGVGVTVLPYWLACDDLDRGALVVLARGAVLGRQPVHVLAAARATSARVRAAMHAIATELALPEFAPPPGSA